VHLVGDLHQPLHCVTRYTAEIQNTHPRAGEDPHGDRGGNLFAIEPVPFHRRPIRELHAYWDELPDLNAAGRDASGLAQGIAGAWTPRKLAAELHQSGIGRWAEEGRDEARSSVYTQEMLAQHRVSPAYAKRAWDVAQRRLALAGYRLAE